MLFRFCRVYCLLLLPVFSACSQLQTDAATDAAVSASDQYQLSRYEVHADFSPEKKLQADKIQDAEPKPEKRSRGGNFSPYSVFGKTYTVLSDENAAVYKEQGGASWYGLKFHGHKTSNGEIYDVYGMTAAHKTLPIPSYVRVTNLQNNRSCIVRVNDRGPFHEGRIIDLSYAAATKLGYIGQGTAWVSVEAIDAVAWQKQKQFERELGASMSATDKTVSSMSKDGETAVVKGDIYLQLGAYTDNVIAQDKYQTLYAKYSHPVFVESGVDQYHRLKIGPVTELQLTQIESDLEKEGYPAPLRLKSKE